ncbi:MAG TPA: GH25 family lysozyme [Caulobacteraceae bacterium]|nr:GH25 family lysozyme [Caulobacteraceae bacterium]
MALLLTAVAAPAAFAHAHHAERHRHHAHHREAGHGTRGIDVSHYQGAINWRAVAHDHVSFAYIKATEGGDTRDARFARNWRGAQSAGLRVGAYHYFNFCRSGRAQAANFLAVTPRSSALPPAVDLEPPSRHCRVSGPVVHKELTTYLARVEGRDGRRAVLYVTPGFYRAYHRYLPERPMWRRSISARPARGQSWTLWQYRMRGHVSGIHTYVDLNASHA